MPNQKVKYFKPIYEIENKIIYVKDKDLLGFDSANSVVFQLHLFNMTNFGLSENFILMDDDCFFGKPIKKTDFFYYDEESKKVVPSVVTDDFTEMVKTDILREYNKIYAKRKIVKPHSFNGWKITQLGCFKLLLEQFPSPLINAGFNHNAIPLNVNDLKEIYDLIKNKYQHAKEILSSKTRSIYDLQPQSLFNSYTLNVKKRKVNSIPSVYYDVAFIKGKTLDIEMFVINTSGDRKYTKNHFNFATQMLQNKFSCPTPFETEVDMVDTIDKKKVNIKNYVPKAQYDKIKQDIYDIEKYNKELNKKINTIIVDKNKVEEYLRNEIKFIFDNIKDIEFKTFKYNFSSTNSTSVTNEISQKNELGGYVFLKNFLKIITLFLFVIFLSCFFYLYYFIKNKKYVKDTHTKINRPNSINNYIEDFSQLSSEEKI
jgi:preprotein translocase subunit SecG